MRRFLLLLSAAAFGGCAIERTRDLPVVSASDVSFVVEDDGPWTEVADAEVAAPAVVKAEPAPAQPAAAPSLPPPPRRTAPPPPRGTPTGQSPQDASRERYLANPTRVRAQRITFRCPARYAAEVVKSSAASSEDSPGRLTLRGDARVLCRELTLEADRIVLDLRRDGSDDVQITAKGDVSFVSVQRDQVFREDGAKSLLLLNDRLLPLR